jgi:hypothetical protein
MQSVIESHISPAQQKTSAYSTGRIRSFPGSEARSTPEDVVSLSANSFLRQDVRAGRKPSVPVSTVERMAIKESFSVYV